MFLIQIAAVHIVLKIRLLIDGLYLFILSQKKLIYIYILYYSFLSINYFKISISDLHILFDKIINAIIGIRIIEHDRTFKIIIYLSITNWIKIKKIKH
jgi:hypothetical protein